MATTAREWKQKSVTGDIEITLPSENVAMVRRLQPEAFLKSGLIPDSLSAMITKAINSKKGLPPNALESIASDPKKIGQSMRMIDEVLCYVVVEPNVEMPPKCQHVEDAINAASVCDQYFDDTELHTNPQSVGYHKYSEGPRDEDTLYADQVVLDDKMFIFQFAVGGTADVEQFREELSSGVGDLSSSKTVAGKAKRTSRSK